MSSALVIADDVSTHSRPKAAVPFPMVQTATVCFNTQPPEGGWSSEDGAVAQLEVSTHSRPKAAGRLTILNALLLCFNTQPPEGG